MLNAISKFVNFDLSGGWPAGVRGKSSTDFYPQKAHPCVNPRRLSHFASKLVGGLTPRRVPEKSQKVTETPIGKTCRY